MSPSCDQTDCADLQAAFSALRERVDEEAKSIGNPRRAWTTRDMDEWSPEQLEAYARGVERTVEAIAETLTYRVPDKDLRATEYQVRAYDQIDAALGEAQRRRELASGISDKQRSRNRAAKIRFESDYARQGESPRMKKLHALLDCVRDARIALRAYDDGSASVLCDWRYDDLRRLERKVETDEEDELWRQAKRELSALSSLHMKLIFDKEWREERDARGRAESRRKRGAICTMGIDLEERVKRFDRLFHARWTYPKFDERRPFSTGYQTPIHRRFAA